MFRFPSRNPALVAATFVLSALASHRAEAGPRVLASIRFDEGYRTEVPVAGAVRKGLHYARDPRRSGAWTPTVWVPAGQSGQLCLHIESRDGRYYADAAYRPAPVAGWYRLSLPTRHRRRLRDYGVHDLAGVVYLGDRCPAEPRAFLPISWSGTHPEGRPLELLVNTQGYIASVFDADRDREFPCRPLTEPQRIGYDALCAVAAGAGRRALSLRRTDGWDSLAPIALPVLSR